MHAQEQVRFEDHGHDHTGYWGTPDSSIDWCERNYVVRTPTRLTGGVAVPASGRRASGNAIRRRVLQYDLKCHFACRGTFRSPPLLDSWPRSAFLRDELLHSRRRLWKRRVPRNFTVSLAAYGRVILPRYLLRHRSLARPSTAWHYVLQVTYAG